MFYVFGFSCSISSFLCFSVSVHKPLYSTANARLYRKTGYSCQKWLDEDVADRIELVEAGRRFAQ